MAIWMMLAGAFAVLTFISAWLAQRWGRGSYEKTFKDPRNEIQTTTPWKGWP